MRYAYAKSVPEKLYVACSGGVDSVATAAILSEWRDVTLLHFSHTDHAAIAELETVNELSVKLKVPLMTSSQTRHQQSGNSEAQWRNARYEWFHSLDMPVSTGHTLDDAVEWYLMTCLRGRGEFMTVENRNVFRPFLLTEKSKLVEYAVKRGLTWWDDPTNHDPAFGLRTQVRNCLVPVAEKCEPGLKNMVKRRIVAKKLVDS
jgi:tRNA(Ile)-lysidine synthase